MSLPSSPPNSKSSSKVIQSISLFRFFSIILKFKFQRFLSGVSFDLSDREILCIEEQDVFDRVYSLVRAFLILSPSSKLSLLETLRSNLAVLLPNVDSLSRASNDHVHIASHRNAFKIYSFFLLSILLALHSNTSKVRSLSRFKCSISFRSKTDEWIIIPSRKFLNRGNDT